MTPHNDLEKRLWEAADQLRANSSLTAQEYSRPVLGLIFLKYSDHRFSEAEKEFTQTNPQDSEKMRKLRHQSKGVMYLPKDARFSTLIRLPEGLDIGKAINQAMESIEAENEDLRGFLPRQYNIFDNTLLFELLKIFNGIPFDDEGAVFGKIYEYYLGKFTKSCSLIST